MAYTEKIYEFEESNEHEIAYNGNYGAKGEKRAAKKKATPEQIKKQNKRNKEKRLRRLIKKNFLPDEDYWITLTYRKEDRPDEQQAKEDIRKLFAVLRREYKKTDTDFKFIKKLEIGKRGAVHIHLVLNRIRGSTATTDQLLARHWKKGKIYYQLLYERGGFADLAAYLVKPERAADTEDTTASGHYSTSRNLIRPEPIKKEYKRRTLRKAMQFGPEPKEGYYIDKESIVIGTNPFTGKSYLHYTEYRIRKGRT